MANRTPKLTPTQKQAAAATTKHFEYFKAVTAWESAICRNLEDLKHPLKQDSVSQNQAFDQIEALLREMYDNNLRLLNEKAVAADATGVLTNQTIFVINEKIKAQYPHWPDVQRINSKIINEATAMTTKKTPNTSKTPVAEGVEKVVQPIKEETVINFNVDFHTPFTNNIDMILLEMNDALDAEELKPLRVRLQDEIRKWLAAFYKSMHDLENPNRVTVDTVGILTATTKYSQPEAHETFDHAHLVDKIIAKLNEKYKDNNGCEASVHAMATALDGAQDDKKEVFSVPTDTDGTTIEVDKKTKKAVVKKDGVVIHYCKKFYEGTKKFFSNIWKNMKRFGAWIKSWFIKDKSEERIDVSPEEAEKMEEAAKLRKAEADKIAQAENALA